MSLQSAAEALARGETPPGAKLLKDRRVRGVAVVDGVLLKVYRSKPSQAGREARALRRARERALAVYGAAGGLRADPAAFRAAVIRESLARGHQWSGCA